MADVLHLYLRVVETKTGAWCPICLLPSAVEFSLGVTVDPEAMPTKTTAWVSICPECRWGLD